jgi:hypothetical protein
MGQLLKCIVPSGPRLMKISACPGLAHIKMVTAAQSKASVLVNIFVFIVI